MEKTLSFIALWLTNITLVSSAPPAQQSEVSMHLTFSQTGDTGVITYSGPNNGHRTTLELRSESGIGNCRVERALEKWPEVICLRLHLRGLEQVVVHVGDRKWVGMVSSSDGIVRWSYLSKEAMEQSIDARDPNWCSIRVVRGNDSIKTEKGHLIPILPSSTEQTSVQKIRVPLEEGECWEMTIPPAWLNENPESIRIAWIDFHR